MLALKSHYVSIGQTHCIRIQGHLKYYPQVWSYWDVVAGDLRLDPHLARAHRLPLQLLHRPRPRSHKTGSSPKLVWIIVCHRLGSRAASCCCTWVSATASWPSSSSSSHRPPSSQDPLLLASLSVRWASASEDQNDYSLLFNLCRCMVSSCTWRTHW